MFMIPFAPVLAGSGHDSAVERRIEAGRSARQIRAGHHRDANVGQATPSA
jgi:hypothetical protein